MVRYLGFVHRSPYATWNPLAAWVRQEGRLPDRIVLAHLADQQEHAEVVARGVRWLLGHYGGDADVSHLGVRDNRLDSWSDAMHDLLDAERGPWVIDVTAARTIPKLAAAQAIRPADANEIVYLDVAGYRYEPKPFAWIPYNQQTIRHLRREREAPNYRRVQQFAPPPGLPAMARLAPVRKGPSRHEATVPWESLVVLLNEAGAAAKGAADGLGATDFEIKLPALGVTIARYDLESRRFRLSPWATVHEALRTAASRLDGVWRGEIPGDDFVLQSLASARLLPFKDQEAYEQILHEIAGATRGPNPGRSLRAIAMDTNLFYLEFFTAVTHAAQVPMTRVPVVASSVSLSEIRNKMKGLFTRRTLPTSLAASGVHHPYEARIAYSANEEFEMLRTRCRMTVIQGRKSHKRGHRPSDANDEAILLDFQDFAKQEAQRLLVLSNDRGFVDRASRIAPGLDVRRIDYAPPEEAADEADVDQIAYLLYRLAVGYGCVSLTGLGVSVYGDHPPEQRRRFLHEDVRVELPNTPWCRGFLHECNTREPLRKIVVDGGIWL